MATYEFAAGNSLYYEVVEPRDADGVTFVCFNALSGSIDTWKDTILDRLHASGQGSLVFNFRGQANSPYTSADVLMPDAVSADAVQLIHHVAPAKPVYIGLSIGGLFALQTHWRGAPALGLVMLNTLRKPGVRLDWINAGVTRAAEVGGPALMMDVMAPMLFDEQWLAANQATALNPDNYAPMDQDSGAYGLLRNGAHADWDVPWEQVDVPVAVVTGQRDRVFYTESDVADIVARIPSAVRTDVADAGHMVPLERPDTVADACLALAAAI